MTRGTLESLVNKLDTFDFAILVLTPDDLVASRGEHQPAPRDNVLLELGMFIGKLGRERTFMVVDRSAKMRLPTDLAGITTATFQPHTSGSMQSAVGPACTAIENEIKKRGRRHAGLPVNVAGFSFGGIHDRKGIGFSVTNIGNDPIPPYKVGIYHPKLGSFYIFPSDKSGQQLQNQKRNHQCVLIKAGSIDDFFLQIFRDRNGKTLEESQDEDFAFRLVLEDSDDIVLYENKRIGKGFAKILRLAIATGNPLSGTASDWAELQSSWKV